MKMIEKNPMSRRNFLRLSGYTVGAAVFLTACGGLGERDDDEDEMDEDEMDEMEDDEKEEDDD